MSLAVFPTTAFETGETPPLQPYSVDAAADNVTSPNPERYRCGNCKRDRKGVCLKNHFEVIILIETKCQPSSHTPHYTCTWCFSNGYICGSQPSQKRRRLARFKCHQCRMKKIKVLIQSLKLSISVRLTALSV